MKQKHWILIFAAVIAVCLALWLLPRGGGQTALVYQDGTLLYILNPVSYTHLTLPTT